MERSVRNLGGPVGSNKSVGRKVQSKKRPTDDLQEVGLTHSTSGLGEPATRGRG